MANNNKRGQELDWITNSSLGMDLKKTTNTNCLMILHQNKHGRQLQFQRRYAAIFVLKGPKGKSELIISHCHRCDSSNKLG